MVPSVTSYKVQVIQNGQPVFDDALTVYESMNFDLAQAVSFAFDSMGDNKPNPQSVNINGTKYEMEELEGLDLNEDIEIEPLGKSKGGRR